MACDGILNGRAIEASELTACGWHAVTERGSGESRFEAERISALAVARDLAGLETWKAIAAPIEEMSQLLEFGRLPH